MYFEIITNMLNALPLRQHVTDMRAEGKRTSMCVQHLFCAERATWPRLPRLTWRASIPKRHPSVRVCACLFFVCVRRTRDRLYRPVRARVGTRANIHCIVWVV